MLFTHFIACCLGEFGQKSSLLHCATIEVIHSKFVSYSTKRYRDIATAVIYIRSVTEVYFVLVFVDQMQMSKTHYR